MNAYPDNRMAKENPAKFHYSAAACRCKDCFTGKKQCLIEFDGYIGTWHGSQNLPQFASTLDDILLKLTICGSGWSVGKSRL